MWFFLKALYLQIETSEEKLQDTPKYSHNKEEWSQESCWSAGQLLLEELGSPPLEGFKQGTNQPSGVVVDGSLVRDGQPERMTSQVPPSISGSPGPSLLIGKGSADHWKSFGSNDIESMFILSGLAFESCARGHLVTGTLGDTSIPNRTQLTSPSPWLATVANPSGWAARTSWPRNASSSPIFPQFHISLLCLAE